MCEAADVLSTPTGPLIGIDARAASEEGAGRGRLVRELLRALAERPAGPDAPRFVLYARERWVEPLPEDRFRWRLIAANDPLWHLRAARMASRECDVFLSTNSYLTVLFLRIPSVTVVYDLITFDPGMRPNRRSMLIERATLGAAVRRTSALVAISNATRDALIARFPRAAAKTVVAPLGVAAILRDPPGAAAASGGEHGSSGAGRLPAQEAERLPPAGFVLAVGTLEPRKNLPRLVAAYSRLGEDLQARHPLAVAGRTGWETGETFAALQSLGDRCTRLGYVSDGQLAELYRRCAVFCYPSLGEGFGLPVLEAMAAGAAVVTSSVSSLPEVGGDAVEYADPHSTESIAEALRRVLEDERLRASLRARARVRALEFSWERFATTVLETLLRAATTAGGTPGRLTN